MKHAALVLLLGLSLVCAAPVRAGEQAKEPTIYIFWGETCPHSQRLMAHVRLWQKEDTRLKVREFEVDNNVRNAQAHEAALARIGITGVVVVPVTIIGENVLIGFEDDGKGATTLKDFLAQCRTKSCPDRMHDLIPSGGGPALETALVPPPRATCAAGSRTARVPG